MLDNFELYNVHAESGEMEKWHIPNAKIDYVEYNRKEQLSNINKFISTEGKCQKGYRQLQGKNRTCQLVNFESMTEQLMKVSKHKHHVRQFDDSSAVRITYLGRTERSRNDAIKAQ